MQKRKLRDLEASELGLGCMGMSYGYGEAKDENAMINLIHKALDLGISFLILPKCMDHTPTKRLLARL